MHELSVASAVVDTALRHAEGRRVLVVNLRVGELRQVVPDSLAFYWDVVSRETLAEGARLDQVVVPVRMRCAECAAEFAPELMFRCPSCGGAGEVLAGDELEVDSIEVEEDSECIASR
jgi:hydrogenase nickel incorporation protein HypA/HybF